MELLEAFSDAARIFEATKTAAGRARMVADGFMPRLLLLVEAVLPSSSTPMARSGAGVDEEALPDIKLVLLLIKCLRNCVIECDDNATYIYSHESAGTTNGIFTKLSVVCKWVLINHFVKGAEAEGGGDSDAFYSDITYDGAYSDIALAMNQFVANFTACGHDKKHFVWTSDGCRDLFSNLIAVSVLTKNKKALVASIAAIINSIKCEHIYCSDDESESYRIIDIFASPRSRPVLSQWLLSVMDLQRSKNHDNPDDEAILQWNHLLVYLVVEEGVAFRIVELVQTADGCGASHEQVVLLRLLYDVAEDPAAHEVLSSSQSTLQLCCWLARGIAAAAVEDILDIENIIVNDRAEARLSINQKLLVESAPLLMRLLSALLALLPPHARAEVGRCSPILDHCLRLLVKRPTGGSEQALKEKLAATRAIAASFDPHEENTLQDTLRTAMQLLSNLIYRCEELQDQLRELGGLPVVLSRAATDFASPLMREWALLCLRNACEGNPRNQTFIEGLKLQAVVDKDDIMGKQGVKLDVDKATGKITVVKTAPADMDVSKV